MCEHHCNEENMHDYNSKSHLNVNSHFVNSSSLNNYIKYRDRFYSNSPENKADMQHTVQVQEKHSFIHFQCENQHSYKGKDNVANTVQIEYIRVVVY